MKSKHEFLITNPNFSFSKTDLEGNYILNKETEISKENVEFSLDKLTGSYSVYSCENVIMWEGKFDFQSALRIDYKQEFNSTHFYLLNFQASQSLNIRARVEVPIEDKLLNNQSKSGTLFWSSNVGIDLMIPANTSLNFQLSIIPKSKLETYLNTNLAKNKQLNLYVISRCPLFFFLPKNRSLNYSEPQIDKCLTPLFQPNCIIEKFVKYLMAVSEFSNESVTFWELYVALSIEEQLCEIPITEKPDIELLGKLFDILPKNLSTFFSQILGKTIHEYHRNIHLEYACWLLETQQLNVAEVSKYLGFKNRKLFWQMFRKHYEVNPKVYKYNTGLSFL